MKSSKKQVFKFFYDKELLSFKTLRDEFGDWYIFESICIWRSNNQLNSFDHTPTHMNYSCWKSIDNKES